VKMRGFSQFVFLSKIKKFQCLLFDSRRVGRRPDNLDQMVLLLTRVKDKSGKVDNTPTEFTFIHEEEENNNLAHTN
jgi:hypothetical protein